MSSFLFANLFFHFLKLYCIISEIYFLMWKIIKFLKFNNLENLEKLYNLGKRSNTQVIQVILKNDNKK